MGVILALSLFCFWIWMWSEINSYNLIIISKNVTGFLYSLSNFIYVTTAQADAIPQLSRIHCNTPICVWYAVQENTNIIRKNVFVSLDEQPTCHLSLFCFSTATVKIYNIFIICGCVCVYIPCQLTQEHCGETIAHNNHWSKVIIITSSSLVSFPNNQCSNQLFHKLLYCLNHFWTMQNSLIFNVQVCSTILHYFS